MVYSITPNHQTPLSASYAQTSGDAFMPPSSFPFIPAHKTDGKSTFTSMTQAGFSMEWLALIPVALGALSTCLLYRSRSRSRLLQTKQVALLQAAKANTHFTELLSALTKLTEQEGATKTTNMLTGYVTAITNQTSLNSTQRSDVLMKLLNFFEKTDAAILSAHEQSLSFTLNHVMQEGVPFTPASLIACAKVNQAPMLRQVLARQADEQLASIAPPRKIQDLELWIEAQTQRADCATLAGETPDSVDRVLTGAWEQCTKAIHQLAPECRYIGEKDHESLITGLQPLKNYPKHTNPLARHMAEAKFWYTFSACIPYIKQRYDRAVGGYVYPKNKPLSMKQLFIEMMNEAYLSAHCKTEKEKVATMLKILHMTEETHLIQQDIPATATDLENGFMQNLLRTMNTLKTELTERPSNQIRDDLFNLFSDCDTSDPLTKYIDKKVLLSCLESLIRALVYANKNQEAWTLTKKYESCFSITTNTDLELGGRWTQLMDEVTQTMKKTRLTPQDLKARCGKYERTIKFLKSDPQNRDLLSELYDDYLAFLNTHQEHPSAKNLAPFQSRNLEKMQRCLQNLQ